MKLNSKELDKKFNRCELPCGYETRDYCLTYVRYDKNREEYYDNTSIYELFADMIEYGFVYHYAFKDQGDIVYAHDHSFDDVIRSLYMYPESFFIPDDRRDEYSKQELKYLKRLQNYLLLIELKDSKEYEDVKKNRENSRVSDFVGAKFIIHDEEQIKNILEKKKDYFLKLSFGFNNELDKRYIILDKEENFKLVLKINKSEIIKIKDLNADMVYLNGKTLKEFKDDFINHFKTVFSTDEIDENTDIVYSKFEIEKIY